MAHAEIHEFDGSNKRWIDHDGDPLKGFYYAIVDDDGPSMIMGPYKTAAEAELASAVAWSSKDYHKICS